MNGRLRGSLDPRLKHSGMTKWLLVTCHFIRHSRAGGNPAADCQVEVLDPRLRHSGMTFPLTKTFGDDVSLNLRLFQVVLVFDIRDLVVDGADFLFLAVYKQIAEALAEIAAQYR